MVHLTSLSSLPHFSRWRGPAAAQRTPAGEEVCSCGGGRALRRWAPLAEADAADVAMGGPIPATGGWVRWREVGP
jgi:hypothetical protein